MANKKLVDMYFIVNSKKQFLSVSDQFTGVAPFDDGMFQTQVKAEATAKISALSLVGAKVLMVPRFV